VTRSLQIRIDVDAARALAHWKTQFASDVSRHAMQIAAEAGSPSVVSLAHFQAAAKLALAELAAAIDETTVPPAPRRVA
jgi:hypothetical protein